MSINFGSFGIELDSAPLYVAMDWAVVLLCGALFYGYRLFRKWNWDREIKKAKTTWPELSGK